MEHNLGLTCDPVAGQVQVPCIERNAIASVKAINAARMAMRRTSEPRVSLDKVIETMYETGKDMNAKYRETSRGGLAIKVQCDKLFPFAHLQRMGEFSPSVSSRFTYSPTTLSLLRLAFPAGA